MSDKYQTFTEMLNAWWGGGITTFVAAFFGRLMFHSTETRSGRREFLGPELIWEFPLAVGMALIGEGVCFYLEAGPMLRPAIVGGMAYIGPRGAEAMFMRWVATKIPPRKD